MSSKGSESCRNWRTRENPFSEHWDDVLELLKEKSDFKVSGIFSHLQESYPGQYSDGQLRTLQRHVRLWRAKHGEEQEIFFNQEHCPGGLMQVDWMDGTHLDVRVNRMPFGHKLCHSVLTYSRWEWACVCFNEDFLSLRMTLQAAMFKVGGVPHRVQLDRTSAATHRLCKGKSPRKFTAAFQRFLDHFRIPSARMINTGCPNENGSVESLHGHFRRRLDQALVLRGSRDFESVPAYEGFVRGELAKANRNRNKRLLEEREHLLPLPETGYPEFEEAYHRIGVSSTVRIKNKVYSVPSRLIGFSVTSRIYRDRIELYVEDHPVHCMKRAGDHKTGIDWRDLVVGLLRKPGAFARYTHRGAMFPSAAYERLCSGLEESLGERAGGLEYLRILKICRDLDELSAAAAVERLLSEQWPLSVEGFRSAAGLSRPASTLEAFSPNLSVYDQLVEGVCNE